MKKVLVTMPVGGIRDSYFPPHVKKALEEKFDVVWNDKDSQMTQQELHDTLPGFDAVMTGWGSAVLDESVLSGNDRLKLIVHTGGTVANLVDDYVYSRGIRVFSGNKMFAESVAEGTIAYMLAAQRRLPYFINNVARGEWRDNNDLWEGLLDKTVGIVGVGMISRLLIPMLQPFRVKIKIYSGWPLPRELTDAYRCQPATLDEIFSSCDIITVHSALNDHTRGLIRKRHFDLIKPGALFVNTSRGDVLDEQELLDALKENRFRAVLDVYHKEPLPADHPFRSLPNVYAIPHMAGPTYDRRWRIAAALTDEMSRFFGGENGFEFEITEALAKRMTKER